MNERRPRSSLNLHRGKVSIYEGCHYRNACFVPMPSSAATARLVEGNAIKLRWTGADNHSTL